MNQIWYVTSLGTHRGRLNRDKYVIDLLAVREAILMGEVVGRLTVHVDLACVVRHVWVRGQVRHRRRLQWVIRLNNVSSLSLNDRDDRRTPTGGSEALMRDESLRTDERW